MSKSTFSNWQDARDCAERRAKDWKLAQGIEYSKFGKYWVVRSLPPKHRRFGYDATCEAVEVPDHD